MEPRLVNEICKECKGKILVDDQVIAVEEKVAL